MNLYNSFDMARKINKPVLTTGVFDGVHIGHRKIIDRLIAVADQTNGESVILTFFPHPQIVLNPENFSIKLLNSRNEKTELLRKTGVNHVIEIPFTKEFAALSSDKFIKDILVDTLHVNRLVIGYDHHFGKGRSGNFSELKQNENLYGFKVEEIPSQDIEHIAISSTKIRNALNVGNVKTANSYLGYNYFLCGTVIGGSKIGRKIGFPTANIQVEDVHKLIPGNGVYAVKVIYSESVFNGMLNIGTNPTVNGTELRIEVNIFDFGLDIYGETICIEFIEKMRDEYKFSGIETLKLQMEQDKIMAKKLLE